MRAGPTTTRENAMRGNIAQLMQRAHKMQEDMQRVQEELANPEVTGNAGGGMVAVTLTDRMERSEEHTSELQPLMRISYAVLCLKKHDHVSTDYNTTTDHAQHQAHHD